MKIVKQKGNLDRNIAIAIGASTKQRTRPQYGLNQADSNFTGLYNNSSNLTLAQYQRRVGTQDVRSNLEGGGSFIKGIPQQSSYHLPISSNRNLA